MVLGEPQILGQMKQAVRVAEEAGTLGTLLHKLFQRTFSVAKEVRSTTDDRRQHRLDGRCRACSWPSAFSSRSPNSACCSSAPAR